MTTVVVACVVAMLSSFVYVSPARAAGTPVVTSPGNQFSGVGVAVSLQMGATGGTGSYSFTVIGLPAGLSMSAAGLITGAATAAGTVTTKVTAKDSANTPSAQLSFTWTTGTAPVVTPLPAPGTRASTLNTLVSGMTHTATGPTTPYVWSATGLPTGLSINSSTGAVTGTPTAAGTYLVKVVATNAAKIPSAALSYNWNVASALTVVTPATQQATIDQQATLATNASGGATPYAFTATSLPAGLAIDGSTGVVSGKPTTAGTSATKITVTDAFARTVPRRSTGSLPLPRG